MIKAKQPFISDGSLKDLVKAISIAVALGVGIYILIELWSLILGLSIVWLIAEVMERRKKS